VHKRSTTPTYPSRPKTRYSRQGNTLCLVRPRRLAGIATALIAHRVSPLWPRRTSGNLRMQSPRRNTNDRLVDQKVERAETAAAEPKRLVTYRLVDCKPFEVDARVNTRFEQSSAPAGAEYIQIRCAGSRYSTTTTTTPSPTVVLPIKRITPGAFDTKVRQGTIRRACGSRKASTRSQWRRGRDTVARR
jgi:hypothetical protein